MTIPQIMHNALVWRYRICLSKRRKDFKDFTREELMLKWNEWVARSWGLQAWSKARYDVFLQEAVKNWEYDA